MTVITGGVCIGDLFRLGDHLLDGLDLEDLAAVPSTARGLAATDLPGRLRELVAMGQGLNTKRPFYHLYISPRIQDPVLVDMVRRQVEKILGLEHAPRIGVTHPKGPHRGDHSHFVYLRAQPDFRVLTMSWDYLKRGTAVCAACYEHGVPAPPIAHPIAVARWLHKTGQGEIAEWLMQHASARKPRHVAETPAERQRAERTGMPTQQAQVAIYTAFDQARDGPAFIDLLLAAGFTLAQGSKGLVAVDRAGGTHPVRRAISVVARALKPGARVNKQFVEGRIGWPTVPSVEEVRDEQRNQPEHARHAEEARSSGDQTASSEQNASGDWDAVAAGGGGQRLSDDAGRPGPVGSGGGHGIPGFPGGAAPGMDPPASGGHQEPSRPRPEIAGGASGRDAGPAGDDDGGDGNGHGDHAGPGQGNARPGDEDRSPTGPDRGAAARLIRDRVVLTRAVEAPQVRAAMSLLRDALRSTMTELAEETIRSLNRQWRQARGDLTALGQALTPRLPSPEIDLLDRAIAKSKAMAREWHAKAVALEEAQTVPEPIPPARGWWGRLIDGCRRVIGGEASPREVPQALPPVPDSEPGAVSTAASFRATAARHEREATRKVEERPAMVTAHHLKEVRTHEAAKASLERRMVDLSDGVVMVREDPSTAIDARLDLAAALARWRRTGNGDDRRHGFAPP